MKDALLIGGNIPSSLESWKILAVIAMIYLNYIKNATSEG
jgi:hypothetical protein